MFVSLEADSYDMYDYVSYICKTCYEGRAKSAVTNRLPWFYPRYILK